jgi:hypothetical protein
MPESRSRGTLVNPQHWIALAESNLFGTFPAGPGALWYAPDELKSLPRLDHNGVEIGICEKASIILYFSKGKWLYLQGAD